MLFFAMADDSSVQCSLQDRSGQSGQYKFADSLWALLLVSCFHALNKVSFVFCSVFLKYHRRKYMLKVVVTKIGKSGLFNESC